MEKYFGPVVRWLLSLAFFICIVQQWSTYCGTCLILWHSENAGVRDGLGCTSWVSPLWPITDMFRNCSLSLHASAVKLWELAVSYQVPRHCGSKDGLNPFPHFSSFVIWTDYVTSLSFSFILFSLKLFIYLY